MNWASFKLDYVYLLKTARMHWRRFLFKREMLTGVVVDNPIVYQSFVNTRRLYRSYSTESYVSPLFLDEKVKEWLDDCCRGFYRPCYEAVLEEHAIAFSDEADAAMFILAFRK